jgi:hypothetical protein
MNKILIFTSLVYLSNAFTCGIYQKKHYSALFCVLVMTSILFHSNPNTITNIIDKIPICGIVGYGGYTYVHAIQSNPIESSISTIHYILPPIAFVYVLYLFAYGYITSQHCYDDDIIIANRSHAYLHLISSIGHHCILLCL